MYEVRALVGERAAVEKVASLDAAFCAVDLALAPFALLPIDDDAFDALAALLPPSPPVFRPFDKAYFESVAGLLRRIAAAARADRLAFVEAKFFGGNGQGAGVVIEKGEITVYDEPEDTWPDTNISLALRALGVPDRSAEGQDAFDTLGLGRIRRLADWRDS